MRISKFISCLAWIYLILFSMWILLRFLFFDSLWWLALINSLALYIFIPLIIFLPFALLSRKWRLLFGFCFPLGLFIGLYSSFFLPSLSPPVSQNSQTIKAMTFNMLRSNTDYDAIVKMVAENNPDIIGLQEVTPQAAPILIKRFEKKYPYRAFHPVELSHNVGILSRFPIDKLIALPAPPIERGIQVTLRLNNGEPLEAIVAHLIPFYPLNKFYRLAQNWYARRAKEVSYLSNIAKQYDEPVIIMCDCNFTDTSETYSLMQKAMNDSFHQAGWGFGHTFLGTFFPVGRIDYIWHSKNIKTVEAYVGKGGGSDHLPLIAELQLVK
ncbi:metal-dependent hydrolase [Rivularia sp. PCC 7116]|uniref:endonuclease/exonuclease/phosphatase family protein n=1 Tax=Rivularia sp. PCC 7116 TaxID=373994 RepID=UPI00029F2990|nr:endonuclease/exonuclease/phosphatase family protein [Rivularia sp. PCC 7116]AFY57649.1 metal-dependent hydrolase [Rivularia sp. PCC 7116]